MKIRTGEMILELLLAGRASTERLVEHLGPFLSHVKDPAVAVRSALSKLKIAGKIAHPINDNTVWVLGVPKKKRGGVRKGSGRMFKGSGKRSVIFSIRVEPEIRDAFVSQARGRGVSQADLFTSQVKPWLDQNE